MKLELTQEQINYLNGLTDSAEKKEFIMNCIIENLEADLKKSEQMITSKKPNGILLEFMSPKKQSSVLEINIEFLESYLSKELSLEEVQEWKKFCVDNQLYALAAKFRDKEKAEEYILMNKPLLSLQEVFKEFDNFKFGDFKTVLSELAKLKL